MYLLERKEDTKSPNSAYANATLASLWKVYQEGLYTDITVACGDRTFNLHKIVVCGQSKVFAAMSNGNFKEGRENHITLPDEDADIFETVVEFLYTAEYKSPLATIDHSPPIQEGWPKFHAIMYAEGDKYDLQCLKWYAQERFKLAYFFPNVTATGYCFLDSKAMKEFYQAIPAVFNLTPETDLGLRDLVLDVMEVYAWNISTLEGTSDEPNRSDEEAAMASERRKLRIQTTEEVPEFGEAISQFFLFDSGDDGEGFVHSPGGQS